MKQYLLVLFSFVFSVVIAYAGEIKFTENKGQVHDQNFTPRSDVLFSGETRGMVFHLRKDGVSYQLYKKCSKPRPGESADSISIHRIDINWINSNANFSIECGQPIQGYNNYYLASNPNGVLNVSAYESVTFKNVWDGIDIKWYEKNGALEYDIILAPGANADLIKWEIKGAIDLILDEDKLQIQTRFGLIQEDAPFALQEGEHPEVSMKLNNGKICFVLDRYDPRKQLIIDPVVRLWSTYFGSNNVETGYAVATDKNSNAIFTGRTGSTTNIATSGSFMTTFQGGMLDCFLVKFSASGQRLWATYIGSKGSETPDDVVCDGLGNIYMATHISGNTGDTGLATPGSHQDSMAGGGYDAFLIKLDPTGTRLWSTYYGGPSGDSPTSLATDKYLNIYMAGGSGSISGISTIGTHQPTLNTSGDGFVVKFDPAGSRIWGTYYGGEGGDLVQDIETDLEMNVMLVGITDSKTGIASSGSHQANLDSLGDLFLVKLDSNGNRSWSTYYGGNNQEKDPRCAVDPNGNVLLSGFTKSTTNISTPGSYQPTFGPLGSQGAFIAKFNEFGVRSWGTYFRGVFPFDLDVDRAGNIYLSGQTDSLWIVDLSNAFQASHAGSQDAFVVKLNSNGFGIWGTYYGGSFTELGFSLDLDKHGEIYLTGNTGTPSGMATSGAFQSSIAGGIDAFLLKLKHCNANGSSVTTSSCGAYTSPSGLFTWAQSGTYIDTLVNFEGCDSLVNVDLTVIPLDESVSSFSSYLIANDSSASYQWIDCVSGLPIPGETSAAFYPSANGSYAVVLTKGICSDTSKCIDFIWLGSEDLPFYRVLIYPNPTADQLTIDFGEAVSFATLTLLNELGQAVLENIVQEVDAVRLDLNEIPNGLYALRVTIKDTTFIRKVVKR